MAGIDTYHIVVGATAVLVHNCDDDWVAASGIVRDASRGKGNFGLGEGTRAFSQLAGEAWVGPGYRVSSNGKMLISEDGIESYLEQCICDDWPSVAERVARLHIGSSRTIENDVGRTVSAGVTTG